MTTSDAPAVRRRNASWKAFPYVEAIVKGYSDILFLQNFSLGAFLVLLTFFNPNMAAAGLISITAAYLFARFVGMDRDFLKSGYHTYNPALVGLALGHLLKVTPLTAFFLVSAAILTFVCAVSLNHILSVRLKLPTLSLPFAFISSIAYLASSRYPTLFVGNLYPHFYGQADSFLPLWLSGFLKSLGAIFFLPHSIPGAALAAALLFSSRILFLLAALGYYAGTAASGMLTGSLSQAFSDPNHFNFILTAMALGGVFAVPSPKSYVLAFIAVCASAVFLKAMSVVWDDYGIPVFTLPFNIVTLAFLFTLGLVESPMIARWIKATPEDTLDHHLSSVRRFPGTLRALALPFTGTWTVWQGWDGKWTHKENYKHAYDFIVTGEDGKAFGGQGLNLTDFHAFGKAVLSPVRGRAVRVVSWLADNEIGRVDKSNAWGNLVVLYDERGFHVEISHFAQHSIKIREGDWVERGAFLGKCGNSGLSPQPHIHIQAQAAGEIGSYTLPFSFVNYLVGGEYRANDLPLEGQRIEPLFPDLQLDGKMSFVPDDRRRFEVFKKGRKIGVLDLTVGASPDGSFYFDSGGSRLYFGKYDGAYCAYSLEGGDPGLNTLFLALPRMPLSWRDGMSWRDCLPLGLVARGAKKELVRFAGSFHHGLAVIEARYRFERDGSISGRIESPILNLCKDTRAVFDDVTFLKTARVGDLEIRRVEDEKNDSVHRADGAGLSVAGGGANAETDPGHGVSGAS